MDYQLKFDLYFSPPKEKLFFLDVIDALMANRWTLGNNDGKFSIPDFDEVEDYWVPYTLSNIVNFYNRLKTRLLSDSKGDVFVHLSHPLLNGITMFFSSLEEQNDSILFRLNEFSGVFFSDPMNFQIFAKYLKSIIPPLSKVADINKVNCYVGESPGPFSPAQWTLSGEEIQQYSSLFEDKN